MKWWLPLAVLSLGGCSYFPQDFDGTLGRVQDERGFRVGLVAGSKGGPCPNFAAPYLARVAEAAQAAPHAVEGAAEPLLGALRRGELDLVLGQLDRKSPWGTEVSILEPLAADCPGGVEYSAIARNGENRWIMLLEDAGRSLRRSGQAG